MALECHLLVRLIHTYSIRCVRGLLTSPLALLHFPFEGAKALFDTTSWDEKPIADAGSPLKITRVRTERTFTGQLEGKGVAEYVMVYHPSDPSVTDPHAMSASYSGVMIFQGKLDGSEEGEVVLITAGTFEGAAIGEWVVDEKTATGGLKGIKGKGGYNSKGMTGTEVWVDLQFPTK